MEKAIIISRTTSDLKEKLKDVDYLYYGNEFCEYLIPTLEELKNSYLTAKSAGVGYVFVTPYTNEMGLDLIKEDIEWLVVNANEFSIVCNDWGVFAYCISIGLSEKIIVGRVLNKMYRDVRIKLEQNNIEENLYKSFKKTPLLSSQYIELWKKYKINRIEFDNVFQGFDNELLQNTKIRKSVYYPYIYLTTSRLCLYNQAYWEGNLKCDKQCAENCFEFTYNGEEILLYEYGKTVFLKNDNSVKKLEKYFDRIILEPKIPH